MNELLSLVHEIFVEYHFDDGKKVVVPIMDRTVRRAVELLPERADWFLFYEIVHVTFRMSDRQLSAKTDRFDVSPRYFYKGRIYSRDEMKIEKSYYYDVMCLMKRDRAVKNRFGEPRLYEDGDIMIEEYNVKG